VRSQMMFFPQRAYARGHRLPCPKTQRTPRTTQTSSAPAACVQVCPECKRRHHASGAEFVVSPAYE